MRIGRLKNKFKGSISNVVKEKKTMVIKHERLRWHMFKSSKGNNRRNWDKTILKEVKVKNFPEMLKYSNNENEKQQL